jgi:hypothetical protein
VGFAEGWPLVVEGVKPLSKGVPGGVPYSGGHGQRPCRWPLLRSLIGHIEFVWFSSSGGLVFPVAGAFG